ncbi:hypothetical protein ACCS96_45355, partial [Rhizobium ruizarguesonis]
MQRMGMVIDPAAGGDRQNRSQWAESPADLPVQQRQLLHLTQRAAHLRKKTGALHHDRASPRHQPHSIVQRRQFQKRPHINHLTPRTLD